jgi:hypothetical protein
MERTGHLSGIIFKRTLRASYATLDLILLHSTRHRWSALDDVGEREHMMIVLQWESSAGDDAEVKTDETPIFSPSEIRSVIRRWCKLGTLIQWKTAEGATKNVGLQRQTGMLCPEEIADGAGNSLKDKRSTTSQQDSNNRRLTLQNPIIVINDVIMKADDNQSTEMESAGCVTGSSVVGAKDCIFIKQVMCWDAKQCQMARNKFYPPLLTPKENQQQRQHVKKKSGSDDADEAGFRATHLQIVGNDASFSHGGKGSEGKRQQGEILADFLIKMIQIRHSLSNREEAIRWLNQGSGVIDVAGGIGHVSMALALRGVKSTVIDPRPSAGKLPGRDRKIYRKALSNQRHETGLTQSARRDSFDAITNQAPTDWTKATHPVLEFDVHRAWFGVRPEGADFTFREGGHSLSKVSELESTFEETIPVCTLCSDAIDGSDAKSRELLSSCSAVVALHPDEATEFAINFAIEERKAFVIVPCCVFSRLFPHRKLPSSNKPVSTYKDLLEYLQAKNPSTQMELLQFEGANNALWCAF